MIRPRYEDGMDVVDYVFKLNVYVKELEKSAKKLRLGIRYAQEVIPTDIPPFEALLNETRWIDEDHD